MTEEKRIYIPDSPDDLDPDNRRKIGITVILQDALTPIYAEAKPLGIANLPTQISFPYPKDKLRRIEWQTNFRIVDQNGQHIEGRLEDGYFIELPKSKHTYVFLDGPDPKILETWSEDYHHVIAQLFETDPPIGLVK